MLPMEQEIRFGDRVQETVMPVVAKRGDRVFPMGTGFIISADGLMMTAAHVMRGISDVLVGPGRLPASIEGELYTQFTLPCGTAVEPLKSLLEGFSRL